MHFFFNQFAPTSVGTSIPALQIKPFHKSDYYRLPQWTVQSATVDRTVCYSGLYSPLP
ncbi:MAG: hypothetical protein UEP29_01035 [Phocaeicola massiliensis]|nr:hypothetical protein [Phocaeicola massiliensis]MBS1341945.1 hypothetical protein [Bacteroides sp.]MEE0194210.1 hypothetical protein [Phocaeicola massiliensis]